MTSSDASPAATSAKDHPTTTIDAEGLKEQEKGATKATVIRRARRVASEPWAHRDLVVLALLAIAGAAFLNRSVNSTPLWIAGTYLALPAAACVAFRVRRKHRAAYGVVEFAIGFVAGASAFLGSTTSEHSIKFLACVAAIYIMVRALDSIAIGFPGLEDRRYWRAIFVKDLSADGG